MEGGRIAVGVLLQRAPLFNPEIKNFDKLYFKYRVAEDLKRPKLRQLDIYNEKELTDEQKEYRKSKRFYDYENAPVVSRPKPGATENAESQEKGKKNWRNLPLKNFEITGDFPHKYLHREPCKSLHLLVKKRDCDEWDLPWTYLKRTELLHTGAERFLKEIFDESRHETCVVGKVPILFYKSEPNTKIFVMKSRFVTDPEFPGRMDVIKNYYSNYAFLSHEEIKSLVTSHKYDQLKNLLPII